MAFAASYGDDPRPLQYAKKFHEGDSVMMKIDGRRGIVLSVFDCMGDTNDMHHSCDYQVRFPAEPEHTGYWTTVAYDYELMPAKANCDKE